MATARPQWKAIIFDFDGTLAQLNIDFPGMRAAVGDLISHYRIPAQEVTQSYVLEMVEAGRAFLAHRSPREAARFHHDAQALITQMELTAADRGALFGGTRRLLAELSRRSIRTGVITRNCRPAIFRIFPDMNSFCPVVLTREDPYRVKPDPDQLKAALDSLEVAPADAAMVGDHPMDIRTGRDAGTFTIGVLTGSSSRQTLQEAEAGLIVSHAEEILTLLP